MYLGCESKTSVCKEVLLVDIPYLVYPVKPTPHFGGELMMSRVVGSDFNDWYLTDDSQF
jgi:hypothetical protein